MARLGRDVSTLSDGLPAFCFLGIFGCGFGGLSVTLAFGICTGTDVSSSLCSAQVVARRVKRTVPVVSSFTVYDRFPSIETTAPHDRRVFLS